MLELNKDRQWVMDLNEEEEKSEEKTSKISETDFFENTDHRDSIVFSQNNALVFFSKRSESIPSNNLEVSLPPPKILG
ncbi:hypothetical protein DZC72_06370 [Maribacter algicola]|uniref:Uncharacterized protein n=2 Tax=Maribacter algicola TaxID=2498892 RepID=A0A426RMH8_9FLAO|nr:hypothetical protein DZC72_06370 [Maribacter algicola]